MKEGGLQDLFLALWGELQRKMGKNCYRGHAGEVERMGGTHGQT